MLSGAQFIEENFRETSRIYLTDIPISHFITFRMSVNFSILNLIRITFAVSLLISASQIQAAEWMKLVNWRYVSNSINDGDSFMVKNRGTTYVFRLYWVDTPEARENYPARVREQAEYFGISTEEVMQIGREAKLFTREFLKGQSLTLYTEWEDGQGTGQRYFAMINSQEGSLVEALVQNELARI
jgi:endonuclease YncB( thermonuclease family)